MNITIINSPAGFLQLKNEWNILLKKSSANCLFLTWEWLSAWLTSQENDIELCITIVRDDNQKLIGFAPLYNSKIYFLGRIKYKTLRVMADTSAGAEYADFITEPRQEKAIKRALWRFIAQQHNWDIVWMPKHKGWTTSLTDTKNILNAEKRIRYYIRPTVFSSFQLPEKFASYFTRLSKKKRTDIRQTERRIDKLGHVEYECCQSAEEIDAYLNILLDLHHRRWQVKGQLGSFIRNPQLLDFYRQILPAAHANKWLRFLVLKVDGQAVACQIGYKYNNIFYAIQEGFDPKFHPGIGNLLRIHAIKQCINEGIDEYDFLGGYSDHKRRWGAEKRIGYDIFAYKNKLKNLPFFFYDIWPTGRYFAGI